MEFRRNNIEMEAATLAKRAVSDDVEDRHTRKVARIREYVQDNAPWHREFLSQIDYTLVPHNPTESQIDDILHQHEFREEVRVKGEVRKLLADGDSDSLKEKAGKIARQVSDRSKNELAHYVSLRIKCLGFIVPIR